MEIAGIYIKTTDAIKRLRALLLNRPVDMEICLNREA